MDENREAESRAPESCPPSGAEGAPKSMRSEVPPLLRGAPPSKVLERLLDGDPLEIEARCREHLERHAFLIDPERLFLRTVAVTANEARRWNGWPPLGPWLGLQMERSFVQLQREDTGAVLSGMPVVADQGIDYAYLVDVLGVETDHARHAALVFNALPEHVRRCWWATAIDGRSLEDASSRGLGAPDVVLSAVKRAVRALASLSDPEVRLAEEWNDE